MKKRLLCAVLAAVLCLGSTPAAYALRVEDARAMLQENYVDNIPDKILSLPTLEEILAALDDPYTVYMSGKEYDEFMESVDGSSVVGIGVSLRTVFEEGFAIISVLPDSPALEAGLKPGDIVIEVDGVPVTAQDDPARLIRGEEGTSITVTVFRPTDRSRHTCTMVRRDVPIPIVTYEIRNKTGWIDCSSFGSSTYPTVRRALEEMEGQVSQYVVDLRSNPGGSIDAAVSAAGVFVGGGKTMVSLHGQPQNNYSIFTVPTLPDLTDKPVIILTSRYSASGSELFSAALRDFGAAVAIGERTFGKGLAQTVYTGRSHPKYLDDDTFKITTHRFYSPDGTTNHLSGLLPSLLVSREDSQAVAELLSGSRPWRAEGWLKLTINASELYIYLNDALAEESREAFCQLLAAIPPIFSLQRGVEHADWEDVTTAQLAEEYAPDCPLRHFPDVDGSEWADEINTLAVYRLLAGYEDGTFRPENTLTRAEFCTMVASAFALPTAGQIRFPDVSPDSWYAGTIAAMTKMGFISGYEDGTFRPDDTITYQEMVTILGNVCVWANLVAQSIAEAGRTEHTQQMYAAFSPWAQLNAEILNGMGTPVDLLFPEENVTREVAAATLCAMLEGLNLIWD